MNQLEFQWGKLLVQLQNQFGKKPDVDALLFLIGVRELGKMPEDFSKEEKQNLMHIATCKLLSRHLRLRRFLRPTLVTEADWETAAEAVERRQLRAWVANGLADVQVEVCGMPRNTWPRGNRNCSGTPAWCIQSRRK